MVALVNIDYFIHFLVITSTLSMISNLFPLPRVYPMAPQRHLRTHFLFTNCPDRPHLRPWGRLWKRANALVPHIALLRTLKSYYRINLGNGPAFRISSGFRSLIARTRCRNYWGIRIMTSKSPFEKGFSQRNSISERQLDGDNYVEINEAKVLRKIDWHAVPWLSLLISIFFFYCRLNV